MSPRERRPKKKAASLLRTVRTLRRAKSVEVPAGGPTCRYVALIMDGNGRWAKRRHLPVAAGHRAGAKALRRAIERCLDHKVEEVTCYSFSSENWARPKEEVEAIMDLLIDQTATQVPEVQARGVEVRFIGRRAGIRDDLLERMRVAESANPPDPRMKFFIAFNYGGRDEIVDAARATVLEALAGADGAIREPASAEQIAASITEAALRRHFYAPGMHDPELLIRTSGEERISNFLLWQLAYTELYFSEKLWPDFDAHDLDQAFLAYESRQRRFGGR
jgi:undecaprenyl diphosphate synthase